MNTIAMVAAGESRSPLESHLDSSLEMYHKKDFSLGVMSIFISKYLIFNIK